MTPDNMSGFTAVEIAARTGDLATVREYIERHEKSGIFLHAKPVDGGLRENNTLLMHAAAGNQLEIAQYLIEHGASINHQNIHGSTALMFAADAGHIEMAKRLVQHGAKVDDISQVWDHKVHESWNGRTARSVAEKRGHTELASWLAEQEQEANRNRDGSNAAKILEQKANRPINPRRP